MDNIDRRLVRLLQANGKISFQEAGDAVGLSAPATFQRVRKLEESGAITGYHASVNPAALGLPVLCFVEVVPGSGVDDGALRRRWRNTAAVQECHRLSGVCGYLLKVRVRSLADLATLADGLRRAGCSTRTQLALETEFERWTADG